MHIQPDTPKKRKKKRTAVEGEGAVVGQHQVEVVAAAGGRPVVGEGAAGLEWCLEVGGLMNGFEMVG